MLTFTYSFFWKFIYRYFNLVVTPLLLIYAFSLVTLIDKNLVIIIPLLLSLFIIYYLNKSYINFYKLVPYKIEIDDEKIICSNFLFRDKTVTILIKDIESISGGIFEGRYRGLMKVCDGKNKLCIGFFDRLKNSGKLVTLILSKVDKKIYDKTIEQIQSSKIRPETKNK
ncbi:MAG: hypothetical protein EHM44_09330 [Ignavibacteriales bacterium]|nr:MAG: hypothetical protein EHM44_09330 [Ignavibacteriales bacterium]